MTDSSARAEARERPPLSSSARKHPFPTPRVLTSCYTGGRAPGAQPFRLPRPHCSPHSGLSPQNFPVIGFLVGKALPLPFSETDSLNIIFNFFCIPIQSDLFRLLTTFWSLSRSSHTCMCCQLFSGIRTWSGPRGRSLWWVSPGPGAELPEWEFHLFDWREVIFLLLQSPHL